MQGTERRLGLIVNFDGFWDSPTKISIEDTIRKCVEPPEDDQWIVSLAAGFALQYCDVRIRTPNQTRTRLFFEPPDNLPQAIADWIRLYPLR
jgi:hypothetical protein